MPLVTEVYVHQFERLLKVGVRRFPDDFPAGAIRELSPDGVGWATAWRLDADDGWMVFFEDPAMKIEAHVIYDDAGGAWDASEDAGGTRISRTSATVRAPRRTERMRAFIRGRMDGG